MRHSFVCLSWAVCLLCGLSLIPETRGQSSIVALESRIIDLVADHSNSLVRVSAARELAEEGQPARVIIGTGFFVSGKGHVLTNASTVAIHERIWLEHRGVEYAATLIGFDRATNLAVLLADTLPPDFGFLHLSDAAELPQMGQMLIRMSMPMRLGPTPRLTMVGGIESSVGNQLFPCNYIRVTHAAGPGEGGAAYLDLTGRLVGIQVGTLNEIDSSYVLPARAAMRVRDDLFSTGAVEFGWMGFEVRNVSSIALGQHLALAIVEPDTPAYEAGLMPDDILLQIGDYSVSSIDELRNAMFYTRVGQFVEVEVLRDNEPVALTVKLAKRPSNEPLQVLRPVAIPTVANPRREDALTDEPSPLLPKKSLLPEEEIRDDVSLESPGS
jgi:serine protease DegS|tara:strand:+ start:104305 stop:105456 length:1152 start_codon:yes stop_codon:yes gene_type:complete